MYNNKTMEYKLVPVSSDSPELKVTLPPDIVVNPNHEIDQCLSARGCSKDVKGRLRIKGRVIPLSNYDQIVSYLYNGEGRKPRGLKRVVQTAKIPKRLLPKNF